jgi:hypothetical protein
VDAKTPDKLLQGVDVSDLAIGIQVQAQVGPNRTISMTLGAPMSMTTADLNLYVDKIMSVADRQNDKGVLETLKATLAGAEKDIITNQENRGSLHNKFELEWASRGKLGDFKPTDSQYQQLNNYDGTVRNLKDNVIPKLRKQISELEAKIAAGV